MEELVALVVELQPSLAPPPQAFPAPAHLPVGRVWLGMSHLFAMGVDSTHLAYIGGWTYRAERAGAQLLGLALKEVALSTRELDKGTDTGDHLQYRHNVKISPQLQHPFQHSGSVYWLIWLPCCSCRGLSEIFLHQADAPITRIVGTTVS